MIARAAPLPLTHRELLTTHHSPLPPARPQPMSPPQVPRNRLRRTLGILSCQVPVLVALACALWPVTPEPARAGAGLVLVVLAGLTAVFNLWLALIRPWLHWWRHGSRAGLRPVSGLPVLGTLLLVCGCLTAFGSPVVGGLALFAALIDPDGLPWVPVHTWHDASLWDA
jgi:hypothetical protein